MLAPLLRGRELAITDIPPRTGAGPGIMTAVPEGFRRKPGHLAAARIDTDPIQPREELQGEQVHL